MKKIFGFVLLALFAFPFFNVEAGYVNGYYRKNGTYVNGYYRSEADGNPYNNYSYPGNTNPYTGKVAPGNADTYLNNYYNKSTSYPSYTNTYSSPSPSLNTSLYSIPSSYYSGSVYNSLNTPTVEGGYYIGSSLFCNSGYYKLAGSCAKAPQNSTSFGGDSFYCDVGYIKSGSQCTKPFGGSYIDSKLYCDDGFSISSDGTKCILADQMCVELNGDNSGYSQMLGKCICKEGYVYNGTSCVSYVQSCQSTYGLNSTGDKDYCRCKPGYKFNSNKTSCEIEVQNSANLSSNPSADCSSFGNGSKKIGSLCYCTNGYKWNSDLTSCEIGKSSLSKDLSINSTGADVVILKNFLANKKFYSGTVNSPFDSTTKTSVSVYQAVNGINPTGYVGSVTRNLINKELAK